MKHCVLPFFSYPYTPFFSGNSFIQNPTRFLQTCKSRNYLLTVTLYYFSCREVCGFCKGFVKSHGMPAADFAPYAAGPAYNHELFPAVLLTTAAIPTQNPQQKQRTPASAAAVPHKIYINGQVNPLFYPSKACSIAIRGVLKHQPSRALTIYPSGQPRP